MKYLLPICFVIAVGCWQKLVAQGNNNVGINTNRPDPSAVLDVYSTNKGMLIPRMGSEARNGIANPAVSLLVFDETEENFYYFDGSHWQQFNSTADSIWVVKNNYLYTKHGKVAIGTDTVLALLHIHSDTTSPFFMISTPDYRTIVGLDETDGTVFFAGGNTNGPPRRYFSLDTLGRLGLNVQNPDEALHIYDTAGVYIKLEDANYNVIVGLDETDGTIIIGRDSSGVKQPQLVIDTAGRVGIGEVDANAQLNVKGKVRSEGLVITDGTNEVELALDASGNLNLPQNNASFYHAYRNTNRTYNVNTYHDLPWDGQLFPTTGTYYTHNPGNGTGNATITVNQPGYYKITYSLSIKNDDLKKMGIEALLLNNNNLIPGSRSYNGARDDSEDDKGSLYQTVIVNLAAGDVIKMQIRAVTNSPGNLFTLMQHGCSMVIEKL